MSLAARNVMVLGGTGAVGSAVLRELARRGLPAAFTYHAGQEHARALAAEHGHRALQVDLTDRTQLLRLLDDLPVPPDVVIHCAAVSRAAPLVELDPETWREAAAVNAESALWTAQWLARSARPCDLVLTGGLDRSQSLPLPVDYAATQGMLAAMVMALGHELGGRGIRVNMVVLGVMEVGLSSALAPQLRRDYERYSALRRTGRPEEAARAITWLALENRYIQGKVIPINGGI